MLFWYTFFTMKSSRLRIWIISILHLLIWGSLGSALYVYALDSQESSYLTITAARETYLSQSVFAQFIYAQRLTFDRPARITELVVPMNLPENPLPLKIRLMQNGYSLGSWIYPLHKETIGVREVHLPLTVPMLLHGDMEVVFDGSAIDHDHKDSAPGLFIEPKNEGYRGGNYRIANNEKGGDISLAFTETKTNYEIFLGQFRKNPLGIITFVCIAAAGIFAIALFPSIAVQMFIRKKGYYPEQDA